MDNLVPLNCETSSLVKVMESVFILAYFSKCTERLSLYERVRASSDSRIK